MKSEDIERIQWSLGRLANAITPLDALPGTDDTGGVVGSLTEAAIGITAGLVRIADAINDLAEAVRERA